MDSHQLFAQADLTATLLIKDYRHKPLVPSLSFSLPEILAWN
jgi:hypothetical protein